MRPIPKRIDTDRENETINNENKILRRHLDENITLTCILAPDSFPSTKRTQTKWQFGKDAKEFGSLPDGVKIIGENQIFIEKIEKNHKGYYRCKRNGESVQIFLHVKGLYHQSTITFSSTIFFRSLCGTLAIHWYRQYRHRLSHRYTSP